MKNTNSTYRAILISMGILTLISVTSAGFSIHKFLSCRKVVIEESKVADGSENYVDEEESAELLLHFKNGTIEVKLVGKSSEDSYSIFNHKIEVTDYTTEEEYRENVFQDYDDGAWGDHLFYLPSADIYYMQGPGDIAALSIVSAEELGNEFLTPYIERNSDGISLMRQCLTYDDEIKSIRISALECISTYEDPSTDYKGTDKRKSWLIPVDEDSYFMYSIISSPAGSTVDATKDERLSDITGIEVVANQ